MTPPRRGRPRRRPPRLLELDPLDSASGSTFMKLGHDASPSRSNSPQLGDGHFTSGASSHVARLGRWLPKSPEGSSTAAEGAAAADAHPRRELISTTQQSWPVVPEPGMLPALPPTKRRPSKKVPNHLSCGRGRPVKSFRLPPTLAFLLS
mmetsp:Transcript_70503/g.143192  ORF Transcript_70503/g.143192 Transcript_70503/m.143192 type:complete len:150 (-) Transcript_70503:128-577(-)